MTTKKHLQVALVSSMIAGAAWAAYAFADNPASTPVAGVVVTVVAGIPAGQRQLVQQGQYLASAGDCIACHTAKGGKPFAGGLGIASPIGKIYSTDITPAKDTGIGNYQLQAFLKAQ